MMKLRSQYVPENIRATTLNLFRVPLNLFVCLVLYNVRCLPSTAVTLHATPATSPPCLCRSQRFMEPLLATKRCVQRTICAEALYGSITRLTLDCNSGMCQHSKVILALALQVGSVPLSVMFGMCSLFLLLALWCQHSFLLLSVKSRIQSQLRKGLSTSFVSRA